MIHERDRGTREARDIIAARIILGTDRDFAKTWVRIPPGIPRRSQAGIPKCNRLCACQHDTSPFCFKLGAEASGKTSAPHDKRNQKMIEEKQDGCCLGCCRIVIEIWRF
jgi:hypothetical protein